MTTAVTSNLVGRWSGATLAGEFALPPVRAPLIDTWLAREQLLERDTVARPPT